MTLNLGKWRELWSALPEHGWPVSAAMRFLKDPPKWFVVCSGVFGLFVVARAVYLIGFGTAEEVNKFIVGVAAFAGAPFLIWRTWIADRQRHLSQEELYTSLLTKAVEQLGSTREEKSEDGKVKTASNTEVRLGAIYALEKLARDYSPLRVQITAILCAYVRKNAQRPKPATDEINQILKMDPHERSAEDAELKRRHEEEWAPRIDVQVALSVIGGRAESQRPSQIRDAEHEAPSGKDRLDLRKAHLAQIELPDLQFDEANFSGSCLNFVILKGTQLRNADLSEAHLNHACLDGAGLQNARFEDAELQHASLVSVDLQNAVLNRANLEGARLNHACLIGAQLKDARLERAHLQGAVLRGANLRRASLARTHLEGVDFSGANLEGTCFWKACFDGANLSGANLKDARFQETNLSNAKGLIQSQLDSARGDHETLIPEGFIRPKHWGPEQLGYSQTLNPDSE